jgi:hypothetical protein
MDDPTTSARHEQVPSPDLAEGLADLTRAVRAAVQSWERASTTLQAVQQEMLQTLGQLTARIERIEDELAKRRRPDPRLS